MHKVLAFLVLVVGFAVGVTTASAAPSELLAQVQASPTRVEWRPTSGQFGLVLTVSGPGGFHLREEYGPGQGANFSIFDKSGKLRTSGSYKYELRPVVELDEASRREIEEVRRAGNAGESLRRTGKLPVVAEVQSGAFSIVGGAILMGGVEEPGAGKPAGPGGNRIAPKDQVIPDDLIVQGSICAGFDCVNNENFGFDTIRLKENNTRIQFDDTSSTTGFPTNNWQIRANSSASGGTSFLGFVDQGATGQSETGTIVFAVEAGAAANALFVDNTSRVGLRTSTPVLDLHISTSNTPGIRLEQTSAGGFTAQTWDIAGNEANFFVRDVTSGSRLPFRIRPDAPTSSIDISNDGDVGMGTASPEASLDVNRSGTAASLQGTSFSDGAADAPQYILRRARGSSATPTAISNADNLGLISFRGYTGTTFSGSRALVTAQATESWSGTANGSQLLFSTTANGTTSPQVRFEIRQNGDIFANGSLAHASSREFKENFVRADPEEILQQVLELPVDFWNYKKDDSTLRHLGPTAEDFFAAFRVGSDDKSISVADSAGVAFAAIKGLHEMVEEKDEQIVGLKEDVAELRAMVEELSEQVASPK